MKINILVASEFNEQFIQGMSDRMSMSYYKYGPVRQAFPKLVDAIQTLKLKLLEYEETGNTEFLIDVANYAMIEFTLPKHLNAHFKATDNKDSKGRLWNKEVDFSHRRNDE